MINLLIWNKIRQVCWTYLIGSIGCLWHLGRVNCCWLLLWRYLLLLLLWLMVLCLIWRHSTWAKSLGRRTFFNIKFNQWFDFVFVNVGSTAERWGIAKKEEDLKQIQLTYLLVRWWPCALGGLCGILWLFGGCCVIGVWTIPGVLICWIIAASSRVIVR